MKNTRNNLDYLLEKYIEIRTENESLKLVIADLNSRLQPYGQSRYEAPVTQPTYGQSRYEAPVTQPPVTQPPYGQPRYEEPVTQPRYGQPHDQPQYGQLQYAKPRNGQPQYAQQHPMFNPQRMFQEPPMFQSNGCKITAKPTRLYAVDKGDLKVEVEFNIDDPDNNFSSAIVSILSDTREDLPTPIDEIVGLCDGTITLSVPKPGAYIVGLTVSNELTHNNNIKTFELIVK